eukprot:gene8580-405_t
MSILFPIRIIGKSSASLALIKAVSYEEGRKFAEKFNNVLFFEMSVKLCVNVEEVFYAILSEIHKYNQPKNLHLSTKKKRIVK